MSFSTPVGRARITVHAERCVDCGTRWASGWTEAETVPVSIGSRRGRVTVSRCADCAAARGRPVALGPLFEGEQEETP